jgi:signal transduction histidine kinase
MVEVEGPDHLVHFVNPAFCRLLNVGREELLGKPFSDIVANGASCVPLLNRVYQTGEFEIHANPDESESNPAYWLFAMWPALDAGGRPARVIIQVTKSVQFQQHAAAMNEALLIGGLRQHELRAAAETSNARLEVEIAERERTTMALQAAQAALRAHAHTLEAAVVERTAQLQKSVGELEAFSYSLAHDLRAPLRAIHGFTQIVLEMSHEEVNPAAVQLLNRVIKAADRMDNLIRDVLSLSEVIRRPITLVSVDVDALVRALVQERPELSPPRAEIKIESPLLPILGHEASLSQCLTNLLANAVKFVERGRVPDVRIWTEAFSAPVSVERGGGLHPMPRFPRRRPWCGSGLKITASVSTPRPI